MKLTMCVCVFVCFVIAVPTSPRRLSGPSCVHRAFVVNPRRAHQVGAVLAESEAGTDGRRRMLATGRNNVERRRDATAHAEMLCLQVATITELKPETAVSPMRSSLRSEFLGMTLPRIFVCRACVLKQCTSTTCTSVH